jgi:L-threonylcarbamoyladenylate synthase
MQKVIDSIKNGDLAIIPTETVYGLAADASNEDAVKKIFITKGRAQDNPLIVHVSSKDQIFKYSQNQPNYIEKLIDRFSPGPLTYVLEKNNLIPDIVTGGLETVAIRIPNHKKTLELLNNLDLPIAAPSANLSGRPSSTSLDHALADFEGTGLVTAWLDGGDSEVGIESTVVKCEADRILILRPGQVTKDDLEVAADIPVEHYDGREVLSPGVKYIHYSPKVEVKLVNDLSNYNQRNYLILDADPYTKYQNLTNVNFYYWLRESEEENKKILILENEFLVNNVGLFDRVQKAVNT